MENLEISVDLNNHKGYPMLQTKQKDIITFVHTEQVNVGTKMVTNFNSCTVDEVLEKREPRGEHSAGAIFYKVRVLYGVNVKKTRDGYIVAPVVAK